MGSLSSCEVLKTRNVTHSQVNETEQQEGFKKIHYLKLRATVGAWIKDAGVFKETI